jgi:RNA polymerase sigma-70 factor (ECF subfamily)
LAKLGNNVAFGKLVHKYRDAILALAFDYLQDYDHARDVAQDAFRKAFRNIGEFEGRSRFSSWLYRIAVHTSLDALKKIKQRRESPLQPKHNNIRQGELEHNKTAGTEDLLPDVLNRLSGNQRKAIVLRYFHQKTIGEISEIIDCAESTVRIHLHRAIQKLHQILKKEYEQA